MNLTKWSENRLNDFQFNFLDGEKSNLLGILSGIPETEGREHVEVSSELPKIIPPGKYYDYFKKH